MAMTGLETGVAVASLATAAVGIPGAIYAVITARRSVKESDVSAIVVAVIANDKLKAQVAQETKAIVGEQWGDFLRTLDVRVDRLMAEAKEVARVAAADRAQAILNTTDFMPRGIQEVKNAEFERRLEAIENKVDDVPNKTADRVMLLLRSRS